LIAHQPVSFLGIYVKKTTWNAWTVCKLTCEISDKTFANWLI